MTSFKSVSFKWLYNKCRCEFCNKIKVSWNIGNEYLYCFCILKKKVYVQICSFPAINTVYIVALVQSLSCVQLYVTPWTAACQVSLSFTISWSLLRLVSIESVTLSNHLSSAALFSSCLQSFPAPGSFPVSGLFASGGQNIEASASVFIMNIQGWFPLGLISLISLQSKGLRVFSSTTVWKCWFCSAQPSLWSNSHIHTRLPGKS